MKIVLYVNSFIPSIGGREIVVHYLAREFKRMGHDVRVLGPAGWIKHRKLKFEYPVHRWPTLKGLFVEQVQYAQLRLDLVMWGCDVIHAHSTYPSGYAVSKLKRKKRIPLIITPHGEDIHKVPEIGFGLRLDPNKKAKIETAIQSAEFLTAISDSIEASLLDAGCPADKIHKIPNGIDVERFQKKDLPDVRQWLGIETEAPIILSVGNYHPRKGHEVLLRAMPKILEQTPKANLVIVGRNTEPLVPLIKNLKIIKNVHLTGSIPFPMEALKRNADYRMRKNDRLAALYSNSSVYVSSGVGEGAEGLSLALMDALAAGIPVVATNISGNKDMINEKDIGVLVEPSDEKQLAEAVILLINNNKRMISNGSNDINWFAKSYGWHKIACDYIEVYKKAIFKIKSI